MNALFLKRPALLSQAFGMILCCDEMPLCLGRYLTSHTDTHFSPTLGLEATDKRVSCKTRKYRWEAFRGFSSARQNFPALVVFETEWLCLCVWGDFVFGVVEHTEENPKNRYLLRASFRRWSLQMGNSGDFSSRVQNCVSFTADYLICKAGHKIKSTLFVK